MTAYFSSQVAAVVALSGCLLASGAAHAQSAPPPAPQQPYAPYAAYPPPAWGGTTPVMTERNSPGMVAGGAVLIALGSAGAIAGAALLAAGTTTSYDYASCPVEFDCFPARVGKGGLTAAGATMTAISTAALIAGIPILAVGMRRVPARPEAAAFVPELRVGATFGTLRWQF